MPPERSEALILATRDYGEADCLVVFLTPAAGRITAVAKHARKSKRRFMNCLEPLSLVEFFYTVRADQELARLDRGELMHSFRGLRRSLLPLATAAILAETAGEVVGAVDNLPALYQTLKNALGQLAVGPRPWSLFLSHLSRLVAQAGFNPHWQVCGLCGRTQEALVWFSPDKGGVVCEDCLPRLTGERLYPLHPGSRKLILAAQQLPLEKMTRLRFPDLAQEEITAAYRAFLRQIVGRELRSWGFLDKILPWCNCRPPAEPRRP
jgi:DNA repair protein RecO (recombination protein O)